MDHNLSEPQSDNNNNTTDKTKLIGTQNDIFAQLSQYLKDNNDSLNLQNNRAIPPLANWNPKQVGESNMVIKANGEWWHEGRPILRQALVNLFATILWQESIDGEVHYFLKTPAQKLRIEVEDAPLLIDSVAVVIENEVTFLEFSTKTGDVVRLEDEHLIFLKPFTANDNQSADIRPYMSVRDGLVALINRNTFYHLIDIGTLHEKSGQTVLTLKSGNKTYDIAFDPDMVDEG